MILPTGYCWIWPFLGVPCVKFSGRSPKIQEYIQIMAIVIGETNSYAIGFGIPLLETNPSSLFQKIYWINF